MSWQTAGPDVSIRRLRRRRPFVNEGATPLTRRSQFRQMPEQLSTRELLVSRVSQLDGPAAPSTCHGPCHFPAARLTSAFGRGLRKK